MTKARRAATAQSATNQVVRRRRERQVKRRTSSRSYCFRARRAARSCLRAAAGVSRGASAEAIPGVPDCFRNEEAGAPVAGRFGWLGIGAVAGAAGRSKPCGRFMPCAASYTLPLHALSLFMHSASACILPLHALWRVIRAPWSASQAAVERSGRHLHSPG